MQCNPKISIIITCYNTVKYIDNCLSSIKTQSFKDFEVLVVDDGSTDGSSEIIDKYVAEDNRFRLFRTEHVGFPLAKNIGLDNARGDYIIFLDSDDAAYPQWLYLLYLTAINTKADITTCVYNRVSEIPENIPVNLPREVPVTEYDYLKMNLLLHYSCMSYMWNKLIKRELYEGIRHVDQLALSDVSVMYKIFDKANKVVQVKVPLVFYRQHDESMSSTTRKTGPEYRAFRLKVFKDANKFIFDNYPQSRYYVQVALNKEIQETRDILGDKFDELIDLSDVQYILDAKPIPFTL